MRDPRLDKLADVLVRYSTGVKKGEEVLIFAEPIAMPLIEATFEAVLRAGGNPTWLPRGDELKPILLEHAADEQLARTPKIDLWRVEAFDVQISFWAESNSKALTRFDTARTALLFGARRPAMKRFLERAAKRELRWVGTMFPTLSSAQDAEMSLAQYERFVFEAGLLHLPDPVAAWMKIHERQERVREFLQGKRELRFRVPAADGHDGTDLRVDVSKGIWINCAGHENFPDGEVFCGPTGADGHVNYTFPAVYNGREVEGVRLAFKAGRVVDASARKGEDYLLKLLDMDPGARTLGEIAIGTNYGVTEFSRNTLFDEKIGGTFHAAVGAGYPESGSSNESALHWDMVCDLRAREGSPGGTIDADGELFHRGGRFLRPGWPGND